MSARLSELNEVQSVENGDFLYVIRPANNAYTTHKVAAISFAGVPGEDGLNGTNGVNGANGVNGQGVPTGGTTGQFLRKANNDNFNCVFETLVASLITDATSVGRNVLTAANNVAARSAIGAGTSSFDSEYPSLNNKPTLGNSAALNVGNTAGTVSAGDHTHAGGSAPAGTIILLSNDETDSTEHNNSVNESNAFRTVNLLPNSYNQIKVEAIVRARNDADLAADPVYTFRLKVAGNTVKTFAFTNCGTTTTGIDGGDTHVGTISTIVAGGQVGNTAITITGQCTDANVNMGTLVHAFRVYGIL